MKLNAILLVNEKRFRVRALFRGEFSFSGPWALLNWGPFWKVRDDWCHKH